MNIDDFYFSGIKPGDTIMGLRVIAVNNGQEERIPPKEGDLYKIITAHGKTFELYYGYYEEIDRHSKHSEPIEIYPNFIENPVYTDDGIPFATAMQDPCKHFKLGAGRSDDGEDNTCSHCRYYEKCEELLGVCRCKAKQQKLINGGT